MKDKKSILVTCFPKINDILEKELNSLDYKILQKENTNIRISGGWNDVMNLKPETKISEQSIVGNRHF